MSLEMMKSNLAKMEAHILSDLKPEDAQKIQEQFAALRGEVEEHVARAGELLAKYDKADDPNWKLLEQLGEKELLIPEVEWARDHEAWWNRHDWKSFGQLSEKARQRRDSAVSDPEAFTDWANQGSWIDTYASTLDETGPPSTNAEPAAGGEAKDRLNKWLGSSEPASDEATNPPSEPKSDWRTFEGFESWFDHG
ncbi:hypothetical protein Pan216_23350 [Planctomycetes bacterium Pan216]|uniref:Uncharacterized protein n=1 Tax=Kolteria novifilia TaxID=2527975 RepID=A0A518B3C7_9BACT|nr:hypothetical protein Pan216_23350 [Planctomycetes bacterium Pan216]